MPQVSSVLRRTPIPAWRLLLVAGAAALAFATATQAATYYVSQTDGVDTNTGLSQTPGANGPWKSISKVSGFAFQAGDVVNFKKGDTWLDSGTLTISDQGTSVAPITIQSYGTALTKPILDGNNLSNPRVRLVGANYIVFKNFIVRNSASACITVDGNSGNITILTTDVSNSGGIAVNVATAHDVMVDGCTVTGGGNGGIQFTGTLPFSTTVRNCTVQNCTVSGSLGNDGIVVHEGSPYDGTVLAGANFTFRNNTSTDNDEQGFDITAGTNILMENNVTNNNHQGGISIGHSANGVTVRYHKAQNEPTATTASTLHIASPNTTVEYSTFIGGSVNQPIILVEPAGTLAQPENLVLRNNVFVWNSSTAGDYFRIGPDYLGTQITAQNLTMKNNIFATRTAVGAAMRFTPANRPPNYATYVIRNNLYDDAPATTWTVAGTNYASFAAYKTAFNSSGSWAEKTGNPLFVSNGSAGDFPGDFRLQSGSTARDAGTSTIRTDTTPDEPAMLTLDFTRPTAVTIPQNSVRDIGAFEYPVTGVPAVPTLLTATAASSSQINLTWSDVANETSYDIDRATNSAGPWTAPAYTYTGTVPPASFAAGGLTSSTPYYFRVHARNASGASGASNVLSATTSAGTPVTYQAESQTRTQSAGDTTSLVLTNTVVLLTGNAVGDWVEYTLNVATAGTYNVKVGYHRNPYRAIAKLLVGAAQTQVGSPYDAYSTTVGTVEVDLGNISLAAGNNAFRFQVTGRNASSLDTTNYQVAVDYIKLTP